jgi:outer membrane protein OmpA-like peptidoglycan-associated protein
MRLYLILFLLISKINKSQNLIPNPSFEVYVNCPNKHLGFYGTVKELIPEWYNPTLGSPDYYNSCSKGHSGVPKNYVGISEAKEGKAYIGLVLAESNISNKKNYREYIHVKMLESFKRDSLYCISFYIKHASYSKYQTKNVGVYFSKKKINKWTQKVLNKKPQIDHNEFYIDGSKWHLICGIYKSIGNEKYLTIGNFKNYKNTSVIENPLVNVKTTKTTTAYYYIDNVSVNKINSIYQCNCKDEQIISFADSTIEIFANLLPEKIITLPEFTFSTNNWNINENVKPLLDTLFSYLQTNKTFKLLVNGHTDNTGLEENNIKLSEKRADAVKQYLVHKGINSERITINGFGSEQPIASNETEEGRAKNRRVELVILNE